MLCQYCNKLCKNHNSLRNHERLCKLNPTRQDPKPKSQTWYEAMAKRRGAGTNQYTKAQKLGLEKPTLSESTRRRLSEYSKLRNRIMWTEEARKQHSNIMKQVVQNKPESYTSSNRGRTKQIVFDGIKFQGKWELEFYQYCISHNVKIVRSNEWFEYQWNGTRKYFPDFFLQDLDLYIEVKGYETERDKAKWASFPKKLRVIRKQDIMDIRKGCFGGL